MSSTHNRIKNAGPTIAPADIREDAEATATGSDSTSPHSDPISLQEAAALRQEKLAAIKKAIAAGAYDSEELLEKAMERMKARIENGEERQ